MLTTAQAAAALGMSPTFVRAEFDAGRLRGYRFGRVLRFEPADIAEYKAMMNPEPPRLSGRTLREAQRLMQRAGWRVENYIPADQLALIQGRYRRMRMPPWANGEAVRAIYAEAKRLTETTGIVHHVDHIIPLQGLNVSGLHVEANLRIITAAANLAKGNKVEPC